VANAHRARARRAAGRLFFSDEPPATEAEFKAAFERDEDVVGLDPATIVLLLKVAWEIYQLIKARRANKLQFEAGILEGELEIGFESDHAN
jgi:hypothetical protein